MPLWAELANNDIPVTLGKLLTGQEYGGSAKKAMDELAMVVDKKVADAGLR
jgi:multiple sugar transport system substrate-binding protein